MISTFSRWYILARAQGIPLTYGAALRVGFLGHASELVVPGQLGGDVVKVAAFCRGQDGKAPVIASVMFDRLTGIFGLFLLVGLLGGPSVADGDGRRPEADCGRLGRHRVGRGWLRGVVPPGHLGPLATDPGRGEVPEEAGRAVDAAAAYRNHPLAIAGALAIAMTSHLYYAFAFYAVICAYSQSSHL